MATRQGGGQSIWSRLTLFFSGLNNMTDHKPKRRVYHDGVLKYIDPEEEKKRISDLDKTNEKDDHKYEGENID